jgi:hypothetical protein
MAKIRPALTGAKQIQTRESSKKICYGKPGTLFLPRKMLHNDAYTTLGEKFGRVQKHKI